jgi:hypothetical protein
VVFSRNNNYFLLSLLPLLLFPIFVSINYGLILFDVVSIGIWAIEIAEPPCILVSQMTWKEEKQSIAMMVKNSARWFKSGEQPHLKLLLIGKKRLSKITRIATMVIVQDTTKTIAVSKSHNPYSIRVAART